MRNCLRSITTERSVSGCHSHEGGHHSYPSQNECHTLGHTYSSICTLTKDEKVARLEQILECQRAEVAALEAKIASLTKGNNGA